MPVDRTVGAQYAQRIIDLYAVVEMQLAEIVAKGVKSNAQRDDLSQKLLALSEVRRSAEAAMRKLDGKVGPAVQRALHDAAVAGGRAAQEDLLKIRDKRAVGRRQVQLDRNLINSPSILRLAASLSPALESRLRSTHLQVVRSVGDIYQTAVAAMAAPGVLAGVTTRREASQRALDHLWQRGVTGFTDKAGRNWNLATYVEMATRTATAQASVQAHLDQLAQNGLDLVMVSSDGGPCPLCQPWEGKVLTTGSTTGHQHTTRPSELDDTPTAVHIDGSVGEATADGLFHPSCRHRLVAYLPGLTTAPPTAGEGADVYAAEQVQRRLEREARRIAIAQAGAVDPAAARELAARYRAKRSEIAQHVKDNPKLRRKTERERVDLGHAPSAPVAPAPVPAPQPAPKPPTPPRPKPEPKPAPAPIPPIPKPEPRPAPAQVPAARTEGAPKAHVMPSTVDPVVHRKVENLPAGKVRDHIRGALNMQNGIAPRSVNALDSVRLMTEADRVRENFKASVCAYYDTSTRVVSMGEVFDHAGDAVSHRCQESGWWVKMPNASGIAEGTFAHEFGHHVHSMLSFASYDERAAFWKTVGEALDIPYDRKPDNNSASWWVKDHVFSISKKVSQYGSTDSYEMLAEIWAEYTYNDNPRAHVRRIAEEMKRLAERYAPDYG